MEDSYFSSKKSPFQPTKHLKTFQKPLKTLKKRAYFPILQWFGAWAVPYPGVTNRFVRPGLVQLLPGPQTSKSLTYKSHAYLTYMYTYSDVPLYHSYIYIYISIL